VSEGGTWLKTYDEAVQTCERLGLGLCKSAAELDKSCGGGCNLGGSLVWVSERAGFHHLEENAKEVADYAKEGAETVKVDARGALDYLRDWRIDFGSLSFVLVCLFVCWACCCRDSRRRRDLVDQDAFGDQLMGGGPSWAHWWRMKAMQRPAGYTGDDD